ncbi:class A beta-lactamase [Kribbella amoyensis]|uniref:class A beta-lactamase n=1 Tax=Kribbella amoyensis TaxID=996641 RepID=UPI00192D4466|nr:class A beta-lactamase [Kribbella amoyensis]
MSSSPSRSTESASPTAPSTATPPPERHDQLLALERKYGARLGVYAVATGTGRTLAHRADERFAFCSTFKGLAAAGVLHHNPLTHLDTVVTYTTDDLMKSSVITRQHVRTGMTLRQLCDAAVRYSDGTAGNLLLRELGGPAALTAYLRTLGDQVTRMDRYEPHIVTAIPGDPRDTTTPRAIGTTYQNLVVGKALAPEKQAHLRDLLERNATEAGRRRIRAGLPKSWTVADKTGTGDYGTTNDIALTWPTPQAPPLLIAILSSKPQEQAPSTSALLAEAATYTAKVLT